MNQLRRGFKAWCENAARGYRRELDLDPHAALSPRLLASKHKVNVWRPCDVPGLSVATLRVLAKKDAGWSAVTICFENKHLIITNDQDSPERQNNSIMHELSHIILKHEPGQMFVSDSGFMILDEYDLIQEGEADFLSGALLVPREALLHFLQQGYDHKSCAAHFEVTKELLQMRINLTGVAKQIAARRRYGGAA